MTLKECTNMLDVNLWSLRIH